MKLLPVRLEDEAAVVEMYRDPAWGSFEFLYDFDPDRPWGEYVAHLDGARRGIGLRDGEVAATFLLAWVGDELVGRASIRHELNDFLETFGGHLGYAVAPAYRNRGYATEMLRQSLVIARARGITDVLVTCDDDNEASERTIERCGGVFDSVISGTDGGPGRRRYWIR